MVAESGRVLMCKGEVVAGDPDLTVMSAVSELACVCFA